MAVPFDENASSADGENSRARVTRSVLRGATIILCGPLLVLLISQPALRPRVSVALATVSALGLIGLELNRRGRTALAGWLFIVGFIALSTVLSLRAGGVRSPGIQASLIFVLMAGLMLGRRAELRVAGVCVAVGLALALAEQQGMLPTQTVQYGAVTQWILNTAYLGFMFLLVRMTTSAIEEALRQARAELGERRAAEGKLRESAEETRRLHARLSHVEDDERRALHTELHDRVGTNLTALGLELDIAGSLLSRNDVSGTQRHLADAREVATETMAMARNLMAELRPPALDDYGLVAALRTFAESQSGRLNLTIHVAGEDLAPRPSRPVESALFRIAQEAVINAARHASATRVAVGIGERDGRLVLTVEDDGVGFDLKAPGPGPDHWGLKNMRERARAVGGVVQVRTAPGAGTRITADAPREAA